MKKALVFAALGALTACWGPEESKETQLTFDLSTTGSYAVQFRLSDGTFEIIDTLDIQGKDLFAIAFDTTRTLSFVPIEGELPVVHAIIGPQGGQLHISKEGIISGDAENNWLGAQRQMQLDLIGFIDSLDQVRSGFADSTTFAGLPRLDSAFFAYADAYRARLLDTLEQRPGLLANLLTIYHRIGQEPVVDYSVDSAALKNVLLATRATYPGNADHVAFGKQLEEYDEALRFTRAVVDAEAKFQPGMWFPELTLYDRQNELTNVPRTRLDDHIVAVWASWCVPCRSELKAALRSGENLENWLLLSIDGLDQQRNPYAEWNEAINMDALGGATHLSDLKGQRSAIISGLGVRQLPLYFRVQDGRITARSNNLQDLLN